MSENDIMHEETDFAELDAMLSQPLTNVADDGFTLRVMMETEKQAARRKLIFGGIVSVVAFLLSFLVPWGPLTDKVLGAVSGTAQQMVSQPQMYMGIWIVLGMLGLLWYLDHAATVRD